MEPVYGVSREVGIGKLKDSLCLSLETKTNSFRTVTNLATNATSGTARTKPGRKKAPAPLLERRLKVRRKSEGRRRT
ncbi:hypothetical protein NK8_85670 (plasmid) [Caballeronia sp. NK8]|nr:hypothetical protein NK8_85670 [Caballeronia sp. NK8]